jgi:ABC-type polysaccharide/polyol phosphate transport system ATPase subunit
LAVTPITADNVLTTESYIQLDHVGIEFKIYQTSARHLKKSLLRTAVGGFIGKSEQSGQVVIRALQDISFAVKSGERVALLGHNGAGKTTLLRALAGIYAPALGNLQVSGRVMPLFDLGLGLDEDASGYENILLRGLLIGLKRSDIEKKVDDIASFSGLGDFLDLPIRTYSSGMMLRLMFSIATSLEAEILLMDEWLGSGDLDFVNKANERLHKLIDRSHILIFASHSLGLMESLCSRGILLEGGRIMFDGPIEEAVAIYSKKKA